MANDQKTTIVAFKFPDRPVEFYWWNGTSLAKVDSPAAHVKAYFFLMLGEVKFMKVSREKNLVGQDTVHRPGAIS